jgi:hypothetical protein
MESHEELAAKFLAEIDTAIQTHQSAYTKDSSLYQIIVIVSAGCGLVSLGLGAADHGVAAGVLGGATTAASVLTQTLHCVKAQGWHDRMKSELQGLRIQFVYEHGSAPTPEALADLGKQYRELISRMSQEWERIISSQAGGLNFNFGRKKKKPQEG